MESFSHNFQQLITDTVAERIVHRLESIQVKQHQSERLLEALTSCHGLHESVAEQAAVHESGQLIVLGKVRESCFRTFSFDCVMD